MKKIHKLWIFKWKQLSADSKYAIKRALEEGKSMNEIAHQFENNKSTIYRISSPYHQTNISRWSLWDDESANFLLWEQSVDWRYDKGTYKNARQSGQQSVINQSALCEVAV